MRLTFVSPNFPPPLYALFFVVFLNMAGFGLIVPLLPFFATSLHAAAWQATLLFSAYSLGQFFAEPFWGWLSDRMGRRPVLALTTAANVIAYSALAFAPSIWIAIAARLASGLGAGNISTIQSYVSDVSTPEQRAGRMAVIGAAFSLGFMTGPALGGWLVDPKAGAAGFQTPLLTGAAMAGLACTAVLLLLKEVRRPAASGAASPPRPAPTAAMREALHHPVLTRIMAVTAVYMGAFAMMESCFGLWAARQFQWTAKDISLAFIGMGAASTLGQLFFTGPIVRRLGEIKALSLGLTVFGSAIALQVWASDGHLVVPIAMLMAAGQVLVFPTLSALVSRTVSRQRQGAFLGANLAAGSAARILGPALGGLMFTRLGPNAPFLAAALASFIALLLARQAGKAVFSPPQTLSAAPELVA